jgi:hypothetical protein
MAQQYFVKNGTTPFAKGASKMAFQVRTVNSETKEQLENYNDSLIVKRKQTLNAWKQKNAPAILQKLSTISNLDEQLNFMKSIDSISNKQDGSEQCFFPTSYANDKNPNNKVIIQIPINDQERLVHLFTEIELQHGLSKKDMMPNIYGIQLFVMLEEDTYTYIDATTDELLKHTGFDKFVNNKDASILFIYLLEELCDHYEPDEITVKQAKNYVKKVAELATATANMGYYNTDFKHGNECPSTEVVDNELQLVRLRGLDFDPRMLEKIDDSLKHNAAALMFAIYLLFFYIRRDIYFKNRLDVLNEIIENGRQELVNMGFVSPDDFVKLIESFIEKHSTILLASFLTATGDNATLIDKEARKRVPLLLIRYILLLFHPQRQSIIGNKRKHSPTLDNN